MGVFLSCGHGNKLEDVQKAASVCAGWAGLISKE